MKQCMCVLFFSIYIIYYLNVRVYDSIGQLQYPIIRAPLSYAHNTLSLPWDVWILAFDSSLCKEYGMLFVFGLWPATRRLRSNVFFKHTRPSYVYDVKMTNTGITVGQKKKKNVRRDSLVWAIYQYHIKFFNLWSKSFPNLKYFYPLYK